MITYLLSILVLVSIAGIVALALNLQWGLGGLVNFGLFGFYMLGAYLCAVLTQLGWSPWLAALAALLGCALASALVSLISVRLSDDYLAIVTLGFAECMRLVITHEEWATRGSLGIANIPRPVSGDLAFILLTLSALALVYWVMQRVARSPFGRVARALRDDPLVAATLGKHVLSLRVRLFAVGGAALGIAGALHAFYYQYIDPTQFGPIITAYAFMAVIIGGRGSNSGVLISSFSVVLMLESSRFLNDYIAWLTAAELASIRLILIGVALVLVLIFRPQGLIHEYRLQHPVP